MLAELLNPTQRFDLLTKSIQGKCQLVNQKDYKIIIFCMILIFTLSNLINTSIFNKLA